MTTVAIVASSDDARQNFDTGAVTNADNSVALGNQTGNDNWVGLRFQSLQIPATATIVTASLSLWCDTTKGDDANLRIFANAVDDAATFGTTNSEISNRARTSASVDWVSPNLATPQYQQSADFAAVLQEVISRPGWAPGNDVAFILQALSGTDALHFFFFDEPSANDPLLNFTVETLDTPRRRPLPPHATHPAYRM